MKKTIYTILLTLLCHVMLAQEQEIIELNALFEGKYEFALVKNGMEINFLKDGEVIRKEFFKIAEINWEEIYLNDGDSAIVVSCRDFYPNCIDRRIFKTKSRNQYDKTILKVNKSEQANTALELLKKFSSD